MKINALIRHVYTTHLFVIGKIDNYLMTLYRKSSLYCVLTKAKANCLSLYSVDCRLCWWWGNVFYLASFGSEDEDEGRPFCCSKASLVTRIACTAGAQRAGAQLVLTGWCSGDIYESMCARWELIGRRRPNWERTCAVLSCNESGWLSGIL